MRNCRRIYWILLQLLLAVVFLYSPSADAQDPNAPLQAVVFDPNAGVLYWATDRVVGTANLDGSGTAPIFAGPGISISSLALDDSRGLLLFGAFDGLIGTIWSLDTTLFSLGIFIDGRTAAPTSFVIEPATNSLFWIEDGQLYSALLDNPAAGVTQQGPAPGSGDPPPILTECNDGSDNEPDGLTDYPADTGCTSPLDLSEAPDCGDGIDNDGDGLIDDPNDPDCISPSGGWEHGLGQCRQALVSSLTSLQICTDPNQPFCGNFVIDSGEVCDGNVQPCNTLGYTGTQTCVSICDGFSACTSSEFCGDVLINGPEFCDDGANNGQLGFCNTSCTAIIPVVGCGNSIIEAGEVCDGNSQACSSGSYVGTEDCNLTCDGFDTCIATELCGDGIVNGPEFCEFSGDCSASFGCSACECIPCDEDADGIDGALCSGPDCDDTNPNTYPGAIEICDEADNECAGDPGFGLVDDGLICEGAITGELRTWHKVTISFVGPSTDEDATTNPFSDYRLQVLFTGPSGQTYDVPGFFAADGNAAETSATVGDRWRAYFIPDAPGTWTYQAAFRSGALVAVSTDPNAGVPSHFDGASGSFAIAPTNKVAPDLRALGRIEYNGETKLRHAGTGTPYIKTGLNSPENFFGYFEFDNTQDFDLNDDHNSPDTPDRLHHYDPHATDWMPGDPSWQGSKGRNIVGAINYVASQGLNSFYVLFYNIDGGDGKDTYPWTHADNPKVRDRYDVSKLDQWALVMEHMNHRGMLLHVGLAEKENDGSGTDSGDDFDDGTLSDIRKLYYRELIARFGHSLGLIWNLGEESENADVDRKAFSSYIRTLDPYDHPIVVHPIQTIVNSTFGPLLGYPDFEGMSFQVVNPSTVHDDTEFWISESTDNARPWLVMIDEGFGPFDEGVFRDANSPNFHDVARKQHLWANLMGGGAGVEWYFGRDDDRSVEEFRTRQAMWERTRYASEFFAANLPFTEMSDCDVLLSDPNTNHCLGQANQTYAVYLPNGDAVDITLPLGTYELRWFDPNSGTFDPNATLINTDGTPSALGTPPFADDAVALLTSPFTCGDSLVEGFEECDPPASTVACVLGGYAGTQSCNPGCQLDPCQTPEFCGDGIANGPELCDDGVNNGQMGFCNSSCDDTIPIPVCGNAILEIGEVCDSTTQACTIGGYAGTEDCNPTCSGFDPCITTEFCGDTIVNGPEFCELGDGMSCVASGGYAGSSVCLVDCSNLGACTSPEFCGDGGINGPEECDDGGNLDGDGCSAVCTLEGGSFGDDFLTDISLNPAIAAHSAVVWDGATLYQPAASGEIPSSDPNLIFLYRFDDDPAAGVTADELANHPGACNSGQCPTQEQTEVRIGSSSHRFESTSNDAFEVTGFDPRDYPVGTFMFWMRFRSTPHTQRILGSHDAYEVQLTTSGELKNQLYAKGTTSFSNVPLLAETWYHIALTYDANGSGTMRTYINGTLQHQANEANDTPGSATFMIGRRSDVTNKDFNGYLDDLAFYDRVLTGQEIADLVASAAATPQFVSSTIPTGLVFNTLVPSWIETTGGVQVEVSTDLGSTWCAASNGVSIDPPACPFPVQDFIYRVTLPSDSAIDSIQFNWFP